MTVMSLDKVGLWLKVKEQQKKFLAPIQDENVEGDLFYSLVNGMVQKMKI